MHSLRADKAFEYSLHFCNYLTFKVSVHGVLFCAIFDEIMLFWSANDAMQWGDFYYSVSILQRLAMDA